MKKPLLFLHVFAVAALWLSLIACADDAAESIADATAKDSALAVSPNRIDLGDALVSAERFFANMDTEQTRSGKQARRVKSVHTLDGASLKLDRAKLTRSGDENPLDTLFYLVNYENDEGFALLAADDRLTLPVYAIGEDSNMTMADTLENKGLAQYFSDLVNFVGDFNNPDLGALSPITSPTGNTIPYDEELIYRNPPSKTNQWDQWDSSNPNGLHSFNQYCEMKPVYDEYGNITSYRRAPVGCVAVAVGLIMSYYQWPQSLDDGTVLNWTAINRVAPSGLVITNPFADSDMDKLAYMLWYIGKPHLLEMNYAAEGSGSNISKAVETFTALGYSYVPDHVPFNEQQILNYFGNANTSSAPIYVRGDASVGGHAWIVAGTMQYLYWYRLTYEDGTPTNIIMGFTETFLYNNWGWGGRANGWYFAGDAWNATDGPDRVERWVSATKMASGWNFNDGNRMILGMRK